MSRSPEITHKIMSAVKSTNTKPEILLGKAMWEKGLRYRKHYKLVGTPDFVFVRAKTAVFCDGDFWHGNNWRIRGLKSLDDELMCYSDFWQAKIMKNINRDKRVNAKLKGLGWKVFRFWESDIKRNVHRCAEKVCRYVKEYYI